MPELPEVETVRRQLSAKILHKRIRSLEIRNSLIVKQPAHEFASLLKGQSFESIDRIGKLLMFSLSSAKTMMAHLKMTGQFLYQEAGEIKAGILPLLYASASGGKKTAGQFKEGQVKKGIQVQHTHVIITFEDQSVLAFRDVRKFGYLMIVSNSELENVKKHYGIDPLYPTFTKENFSRAFENRQKPLKAVLMDQSLIAGIGNIYADEICHRTKLRPDKPSSKLTQKQLDELYYASSEIIRTAVDHKGTTFRDFTGADGEPGNYAFELKAYGRQGERCLQCSSGIIEKIIFHGRGTHYCRSCQH